MNILNFFIIVIWSICGILMLYMLVLYIIIADILNNNNIKNNMFTVFLGYSKLVYFADNSKFKESDKIKYLSLCKKTMWIKRILLLICSLWFILVLFISII